MHILADLLKHFLITIKHVPALISQIIYYFQLDHLVRLNNYSDKTYKIKWVKTYLLELAYYQ